MATTLFSFLFNTFVTKLNDRSNEKFWLPGKLKTADGPRPESRLLPLRADRWNLGAIKGAAGATFTDAITSQWLIPLALSNPQTVGMDAIADPRDPDTHLTLSDVTIGGLDNVTLVEASPSAPTPTGYTAIIKLRFGEYADLDPLSIAAKFKMWQAVCTSDTPPVGQAARCNGAASDVVQGTGTISLCASDVLADVTVDIRPKGPALSVTVTNVSVHGSTSGTPPSLTMRSLVVDQQNDFSFIYKKGAQDAIESPDGSQGVFANLEASLNDPDNRDALSKQLTSQFAKAIDDSIGALHGPNPPTADSGNNAVDQYVFDRLRVSLNDPLSPYYLPKLLFEFPSPSLEPFAAGAQSLGGQSASGVTLKDVRLGSIVVTGASNSLVPFDALGLAGSRISFDIHLGASDPPPAFSSSKPGSVPPPPVRIDSPFTVVLNNGSEIDGSLTIGFTGATVSGTMLLAGDSLDDLTVTFERLAVVCPTAGMSIRIRLASVFQGAINAIVGADANKQRILDGVNGTLDGKRGELSEEATKQVREIIASRLKV